MSMVAYYVLKGVGDVRPGVVDNLSGSNTIGMLLANVELDRIAMINWWVLPIFIMLQEVLSSIVREKELDKVAMIAKDNPNILFELGSHTLDYVGDERSNLIFV